MNKYVFRMLQLACLGAVCSFAGCQTQPGSPVGPLQPNDKRSRTSVAPSGMQIVSQNLPAYQTVDSGLRDCEIPFAALRKESAACRTGRLKDGRVCESYSPTQFPEVVEIVRGKSKDGDLVCSGTLIASNWVLTAAHCFDNDPNISSGRDEENRDLASNFSVNASFAYTLTPEFSLREDDRLRRVISIRFVPGYSGAPSYQSDLALLLIDRPYPADAIQPAVLAYPNQFSSLMTMAGYGVSNATLGSYKFLNVNWPVAAVLSDGQSRVEFAPTDGTAFCVGDSGGPMFAGRYRGCKSTDRGGEPRPRIIQAVVSNYSFRGIIFPSQSNSELAKRCMSADKMIGGSVAEENSRNWICRVTDNNAGGC